MNMNFFKVYLFLFLALLNVAKLLHAEPPSNFQAAKKIAREVFKSHPSTLYCGCKFDSSFKIDLTSCHMESAEKFKRAHVVEWEHIMPAENFGKHLQCWREKICARKGKRYKGRKCCERMDSTFQHAEAELYNLWPAVGLVNQVRSNFRFSAFEHKGDLFGCDFTVEKHLRKVEPADSAKGIVARANLFMSYKYNINLSDAQKQLFAAWNKAYPASIWEKEWAHTIEQIEGYPNPYIN
jgi:deoxyribonuclease-1